MHPDSVLLYSCVSCSGAEPQRGNSISPFRYLNAIPAEGTPKAQILPGYPSLDRSSRDAEMGFEQRTFRPIGSRLNRRVISIPEEISVRSAVAPFRCLATMPLTGSTRSSYLPLTGSTRAGMLPGHPSLDRGSREAERVGFEPRTSRVYDCTLVGIVSSFLYGDIIVQL
ncbi:hypothetical protein T265_11676 [Opisthorchis viverrini]|uniref:Uncharacterized protein n=1 Tax=Opisthorchis viverrini TaxID=6198 RepID=A0A074YY45_OPIVI|nr:hypothetical protein T265_11676 [Opisthorchis viverrini]KER19593.1 hypothetical protein T265_11676 [Opisthorchis viverrini]